MAYTYIVIKAIKLFLFLALQVYENDKVGCKSWIIKETSFGRNQTKIHFKGIFTLGISVCKGRKVYTIPQIFPFLRMN